jgi:hypothetical protein
MKNGLNIVFWGKRYSHKQRSVCPDIQGLKEDDFNVLLHCGKAAGNEIKKHTSDAFDYVSTVGPHEEDLDSGKLLVASPGLEKLTFEEVDEEKGFHLIELSDDGVESVAFKPVTCRPMKVIELNLTLSTSSIPKEIKDKIKHGRKDTIVKLILKGKVLFEIYRNYSRHEVEKILGNRFFFHVIENVLQLEDLDVETFEDISIFSVEDEYALLLDQKTALYQKEKDAEYCKFYTTIRELGLKYLNQSMRRGDQS